MSAVSFSQFLATLSDACLVGSPHGDILDLNPAACGVLGYRKEELIGKPLPSIFAPESHSKVVEHLEELKITRRLCADKMNVLTKKGEKRIMLLSMGSAVDAEGRLLYSTIMLVDISDQERDTEKLLRYAALLESSDDAIIAKNSEGVILSWNAGAQHIFGYTPEEAIGQSITIIIPPELRDEEIDILRKLRAGERIEHYETLRISKGGRRINVSITVSPIRDTGGRIIGASKIARDITERKRAEEALAGVSGRLITAQEQARTRIAREIHDDIGQRLALLANELQQFREDSPNLPEVRKRVEELEKQIRLIANDIQSMAHELHSSKLEYLGIVPAMRNFCNEFSKQQKLEINFENHDLPSTLPPDVPLCFFRVLQEALNNSAKHSGAQHIDVELWATPNEIRLTVSDSGEGFDFKAAREGLGLGLMSMEERLKIVGGDLLIESQPKHGTTIQARVPLHQENNAMRAAG